ncbi:hypothetical protein [Bradyrhizobium sp. WSM1417]|uniref:hypothetical protein n=1 Tax=Bradyrhizobium sp. WSM1417 TaxID=754500 RepID=UPI00048071E7|nr:hypothetical protein [Bradyrhizobium sp. WSM1417]
MRVATLVIVGALDKNLFEACRNMVQGDDDIGISRQHGQGIPIQFDALPDAYSGFDVPAFRQPIDVRGFHFEFNQSATEHSKETLRHFFRAAGP